MRQWLYSDKSRCSTVKTVTWGHLILRPYAKKVMSLVEIVCYAELLIICVALNHCINLSYHTFKIKIKNKKPHYIILFLLFVFVFTWSPWHTKSTILWLIIYFFSKNKIKIKYLFFSVCVYICIFFFICYLNNQLIHHID